MKFNAQLHDSEMPIALKMVYVLSHYPRISQSMMQIGIGSSLPASIWKPIFDKLHHAGDLKVSSVVDFSHTGRQHTHTYVELGEIHKNPKADIDVEVAPLKE